MNKSKVYFNLKQDIDLLTFLTSMMQDENKMFLETGAGLDTIKVCICMIESLTEIIYDDIMAWDGEENE